MSRSLLHETLTRILTAPRPPRPWRDGGKIPWHDPELSERLLAVHLDPTTHLASRAPEIIEQHVLWLRTLASGHFPEEQAPRLLDLGCGPGLYCQPLARQGWRTVGIDISPASIAHARQMAAEEALRCRYLQRSVLDLEAGELMEDGPFDLVTFWFGELNAFTPEQAARILALASACLGVGGLLVVEPLPWETFTREESREWHALEKSFWSDTAHLWLKELTWDEEQQSEITVHWVIDGESGEARRFAQCHRAYREGELEELVREAGLEVVREYPPISGDAPEAEFPVLVARRPA